MSQVTRWSALTLVAVFVGGGTTLSVDQARLRQWGHSGIAVPVGDPYVVDLPAGDTLVYYESAVQVPTGDVLLAMRDAEGTVLPPDFPSDDNSFRLALGGWSGRSLWEYRGLAGGEYTVTVNNAHYVSDDEVPRADRIVFAKRPNTLADLIGTRRRIQVVGTALTLLLASALYAIHLRSTREG